MSLWFDDCYEKGLNNKAWEIRTGETLSKALKHESKLGGLELLCVSIKALVNRAEGYNILFSCMLSDDVGFSGPYMESIGPVLQTFGEDVENWKEIFGNFTLPGDRVTISLDDNGCFWSKERSDSKLPTASVGLDVSARTSFYRERLGLLGRLTPEPGTEAAFDSTPIFRRTKTSTAIHC